MGCESECKNTDTNIDISGRSPSDKAGSGKQAALPPGNSRLL